MVLRFMNIRALFVYSVLVALQLLSVGQGYAGDVVSLRGDLAINADSPPAAIKRFPKDGEPLDRDYVHQPPLIPHHIRDYQVDLNSNKCLTCHSWKTYRKSGATKISQTHFESRDRGILANVSPRRYFCTQCHVPQANAKPLVVNTFRPITAVTED
jgi:nitrate reductase (cytochrome), electron transfer subunit